jgi:hypothetical protein
METSGDRVAHSASQRLLEACELRLCEIAVGCTLDLRVQKDKAPIAKVQDGDVHDVQREQRTADRLQRIVITGDDICRQSGIVKQPLELSIGLVSGILRKVSGGKDEVWRLAQRESSLQHSPQGAISVRAVDLLPILRKNVAIGYL